MITTLLLFGAKFQYWWTHNFFYIIIGIATILVIVGWAVYLYKKYITGEID
jgi:hypothetical protein